MSLPKLLVSWCAASILALAACGGDPPVAVVDTAGVVWTLRPTTSVAVARVAGDSMQLHVLALTVRNDTLSPDPARLTYHSADPSYVTVSATGMVSAIRPTAGTPVDVSITYQANNKTVTTAVSVSVTDTPVPVTSIVFATDSVSLPANGFIFIGPVAAAGDGSTYPEIGVALSAGDDLGITLYGPYASITGLGTHWVYASVDAYGTVLRDSVRITGIYPLTQTITLTDAPAGGGIVADPPYGDRDAYLHPCGTVTWTNTTKASIDVTFDAPAQTGTCGDESMPTGNVAALAPGESATRAFPGPAERATRWTVARSASPGATLLTGRIVTR